MPSERLASQSQSRPSLAGYRTNSSRSNYNETDSPAGTPPQGHARTKSAKHVVGAGGRTHARVPSSKGLHKLTKGHGNEGSHTDLKKLGKASSSTTNLKKNSSHVSLKRNRSSADVHKRPQSAHGQEKRPASVHFEVGDQNDDVWEEASNPSTASPALSRSASRSAVSSGQQSAKSSASNSRPASPPHTTHEPTTAAHNSVAPKAAPVTHTPTANGGTNERSSNRHSSAEAKVITERLLQRTNSYHSSTKMSLTTATPTPAAGQHAKDSPDSPLAKSQTSTLNGTPHTGSSTQEPVSRFVGGSGTPSENSPFLHHRRQQSSDTAPIEEVKRAQSMGNLAHRGATDSEEESALAPRTRKSSQTSRTQQKLWLQRASSNIEPAQMAPGVAINGMTGLHGYGGVSSLVGGGNGAGYDGRDLRIKVQLEKTGLEYLVVRRYQDPVSRAIKRLSQLPGAEKNRRIPVVQRSDTMGANNRLGLSQSLNSKVREARKDRASPTKGTGAPGTNGGGGGSYDGHEARRDNAGNDAHAILQSMWQKSFDLSASAD